MRTHGFQIALLLIGASRGLIDDLHQDLARTGFPEARPIHGFALQAIGPSGASQTLIGSRLGVSKQAAGQTIANLISLGYAFKEPDPDDARSQIVRRSARGVELLDSSLKFFEARADEWTQQFGEDQLEEFAGILRVLAGESRSSAVPGWESDGTIESADQQKQNELFAEKPYS